MRILYQHRTLADGAEGIHIQEMVEAFRGLGHEVIMAGPAVPGSDAAASRGSWSAIKRLLPDPLFELAAIAYNVLDYVTFRRELQRHRPDLVYKRHARYDLAPLLAAASLHVPAVLEVNCSYSSERYRAFEPVWFARLARGFERGAVERATLTLAVSTPLGAFLRTLTDHPETVTVVPNGANPLRFDPAAARPDEVRARYGVGGSVVVGWAGILRRWHRADLLLDAVARQPNLSVLIIGDGPDRLRLEAAASALKISNRVVFTGRQPHADMVHHIAAVDIAVASDDGTGCASPMKILEYMAMARAVVAPRLPNIEDLIEDGVNGVLFEAGNVEELAAVLGRLAADAGWRQELGRRARASVERDRNWRRIAESVLEALAARRALRARREAV